MSISVIPVTPGFRSYTSYLEIQDINFTNKFKIDQAYFLPKNSIDDMTVLLIAIIEIVGPTTLEFKAKADALTVICYL